MRSLKAKIIIPLVAGLIVLIAASGISLFLLFRASINSSDSQLTEASLDLVRNSIFIGLIALAVYVALLCIIVSRKTEPISKVAGDLRHISNGNFDVSIRTDGDDEVGCLSKSILSVRDTLHKLHEDVNIMISEQEKGNVDHKFDSGDYTGTYKLLADNILELASISMSDQLTGLANKRSFRNRLEFEWNSSRREKTPLSLMVVDVDKLGDYNDAFGHSQGDIALQTVASTIKKSLWRSVDFTARWDGDRFIVLLPSTDANGARTVAERISERIKNSEIPCSDERAAHVRVSIGTSTKIPLPNMDHMDFLAEADSALRSSKENGSGEVCQHQI